MWGIRYPFTAIRLPFITSYDKQSFSRTVHGYTVHDHHRRETLLNKHAASSQ